MTVDNSTNRDTLKDKIELNNDHTSQQVNISSQPLLIHTDSGYSDDVLTRSCDQPRSSTMFPQQSKKKNPLEMNEDELRALTKMNTNINDGFDPKLGKKV